jgi:hypothetical protein
LNIRKSLVLKRSLWSLYFAFLLFLQVSELIQNPVRLTMIDTMVSLPALVGLLMHAWGRAAAAPQLWRAYFFVFLTWSLYRNIVLEWASELLMAIGVSFSILQVFIYVLLFCPLYYALFKTAFSRNAAAGQ